MSLEAFRKIQVSDAETDPGTAEAATEILYGTMGTWEDEDELHRPEEERNSLALYHENDEIVSKQASAVWTGDLNFRQITWALLTTIQGNVAASQPESETQPNAYLWEFTPAETTANTPDQADGIETFTFEYGDNTQAWRIPYGFGVSLEISGAPNEVCTFTLDIVGAEKERNAFTAGLSMVSVQRAPFNLAEFYIDDDGGTMGATQKTGLLRGFTWTLETQFVPFYTADGTLGFGAVSEGKKAVSLDLTYKWGADALVEEGHYDDRATRLVRIQLNGTEEIDEGEGNKPYLQLDQAVRYENWPTWGEDEGSSTFSVPAYGVKNSDFGDLFKVALLNSLATLPA